MKKLISAFLLISVSSCAQIVVKNTHEKMLYTSPDNEHRLYKFTADTMSSYVFYFRDLQYERIIEIKDITFSDTAQIRQFMGIAVNVINGAEDVILEVNKKDVMIRRNNKQSAMILYHGGHFFLSPKEIEVILESLE